MKPRHSAEQSTVKVNKAEKMGKRGFASVVSKVGAVSQTPTGASIEGAVISKAVPVLSKEVTPSSMSVPAMVSVKKETKKEAAVHTHVIGNDGAKVCPVDPAEKALCDACQ
jgi:ribonucleoside-diphosphate reductase alpha chain